jgi:dCTP deaminase
MSFWSSQTLESRLPQLIEPFSKDCIESALYELSLGEEVYISALPDTPHKDRKTILLKEKETAVIPPGQFAFLITLEKVSIPKDAIAFISMKFGVKAKGLINVSGFHVDPGYKGRLIFAVYNAGPLSFQVKYGERLFALWLADLDEADIRARTKIGFESIPTSITNGPESVSSLPSLVKRLDEIEKKVERFTIIQAIVWGVVLSLTLTIAKPLLDRYVAPFIGQTNNNTPLVAPTPSNNKIAPNSLKDPASKNQNKP